MTTLLESPPDPILERRRRSRPRRPPASAAASWPRGSPSASAGCSSASPWCPWSPSSSTSSPRACRRGTSTSSPTRPPRRGSPVAGCGTPSSAPSSSRSSPSAVAVPVGLACRPVPGRVRRPCRRRAAVHRRRHDRHPVDHGGHLRLHRHRAELPGLQRLAGAFAIGFIMLPVIIRAGETAFRGVPRSLTEAALALGARRSTIARKVVVPDRPARCHHRCPPGGGPGPGRDGPAAVDHLRQPVSPVEPDEADGGPAHPHLQLLEPALRRPGPGGLGCGAAADGGRAGAQHRQPPLAAHLRKERR